MKVDITYSNRKFIDRQTPRTSKQSLFRKQDQFLFQAIPVKTFDLGELSNPKHRISSDETYIALVKVLSSWNRLEKVGYQSTRRTEFFRNQHIYHTLKNILFQPHELAKDHVQNLYSWYKGNSEENESSFNYGLSQVLNGIKKIHNKAVDEEAQIRNAYRSTLPFQIHQYQRKNISLALAPLRESQKNIQFKEKGIGARNQITVKSLSEKMENRRQNHRSDVFPVLPEEKYNHCHTQNKYFSHRNLQSELLRKRELEDIQITQLQWKSAKARSKEHIGKNFHKGLFKTSALFFDRKKKYGQQNFLKTETEFYKLKKAKIQSSLGLRSLFKNSDLDNEQKNAKRDALAQNRWVVNQRQDEQKTATLIPFEQENSKDFKQFKENEIVLLPSKLSGSPASIDGIGLLRNPLDTKLSKTKKQR